MFSCLLIFFLLLYKIHYLYAHKSESIISQKNLQNLNQDAMNTIKCLVFAIACIALAGTSNGQTSDIRTYSNFDFVPGSKLMFFDDFSTTKVGDFPVMWNSNASGEIVRTNLVPGNWFMMNMDGLFFLNDGMPFPENFTVEFDILIPKSDDMGCQNGIGFISTDGNDLFPLGGAPGKWGAELVFGSYDSYHTFLSYNRETDRSFGGEYVRPEGLIPFNKPARISFWIQKTRLRMYVNEVKVFDIQRAFPQNANLTQIRFVTHDGCPLYLTNFRIANADEDTRSKLLTEGKIVSYGIYFDSGKDIVKPESYGSLNEIATILKENPEVRVTIVGHTDSDGDDKLNLDLSKRRAVNVKRVLAEEFNIDPSRIETDGKGESEPIAPNTNPENKAKNRRVEFIRIQ